MIGLAGCASVPFHVPAPWERSEPPTANPHLSDEPDDIAALRSAIADSARSLTGRRTLFVGDRRYNWDCSGAVLAAYYQAGVDLDAAFGREEGNGVRRLHALATRYSEATRRRDIAPGDLIFWDNTFDRNGNGRWDDPLTHVAIVVEVDPDGTIAYIHHHYRRGIVEERMNLRYPDDPERNSAMRMRGQPRHVDALWLSSHLFREAGRPYMVLVD